MKPVPLCPEAGWQLYPSMILIALLGLALVWGNVWADVTPSPGHYEGTTAQGNSVSFDVTGDGHVTEFCITLDYSCTACSDSKEICFGAQQFTITDTCFWYSVLGQNNFEFGGCFVNSSFVSGFIYYISDQVCGTCNNYVTWEAVCGDCAKSLTLLVPNGGEQWTVGESQTIEWRSTGEITYVRILYFIKDGGSWLTVSDSTENSGFYPWIIPDTPAEFCLIRIVDPTDTTVADVSDGPFAICDSASITVLSPNGGEGWRMGEVDTIRWIWEGCIDSVNIDYTVDGGQVWKTISKETPNTGKYGWLVPATPTQQAYVRVSDASNVTVNDSSDAAFRICLPSLLTLGSPNGGEQWTAGSSQFITWASTGCIDSVGLFYSINGGTEWRMIVSSTPNTASHPWLVPDETSSQCLVKVWNVDDTTVVDISDDHFTICAQPTLQLLTPNGGEMVFVDSLFNIQWNSTGCIEDVRLRYSVDGGQGWITLSNQTPNDGLFPWMVPNTPSDQCLVRIQAAEDSVIFDVSDSLFSIDVPPTISVISPNGGEEWLSGSTTEIQWEGLGPVERVIIDYSTDGGSNWASIADSTANTGGFEWIVPPTPSSICLMRVTDFDRATVADTSDSFFTIIEPRELTILSPNGGEVWEAESEHDIIWTFSGAIDSVSLAYSLTGGEEWTLEVAGMANSGIYAWTVPDTFSGECLFRIFDIADPEVADTSDGFFQIKITSELMLHSPNGGEEWIVDNTYQIEWSFRGPISMVSIEYSFTGGLSWNMVVDSTANDGLYEWMIPSTTSLVCLVRIFDPAAPEVADTSDAFFTIRAAPSITVVSPNGGEAWQVGERHDILWSSTGLISTLSIAFRTPSDSEWVVIVTGTPNDGAYRWFVPNTPSTECRLMIFDAAAPEVADTSDTTFTILRLEMTLRALHGAGHQGTADHQLAIELENRMSLGLLHFSLLYEPTAFVIGNVAGTERVADMSRFWWDVVVPGSLRVTIDEGLIAAGTGPIAQVSFDVRIHAPLGGYILDLNTCALRDSVLRETFLCVTEDGTFTVLPQQTFSVEGYIRDAQGEGLGDVTVTLVGDASSVVTSMASGYYQFGGLVAGEYLILPSRSCWTFQPPLRHYTALDSQYTDQDFIGYTLGRSVFGWGDDTGSVELGDGALEDTFAVWFGPSLPCSLHAVEMAFGSPGTVMMFVWETSAFTPRDGIAPERGTFAGHPLGDVVAGPIPFTAQGTGGWERFEFHQHGFVPVLGGPEEPGRSFFVGWVKVVPGAYPQNIPHILGSNVYPGLTHSWFGGPWTALGGPDPQDDRWGAYDTESGTPPNIEYRVRIDVSFPWCPSVVSVGFPEMMGAEGDTLSVPVFIYTVVSGLDIRSYAGHIRFDRTLLEVVECVSQSSDMTTGWSRPVCNADIPGTLLLTQSGTSPLVGSGPLIHIRFRLLSGWKECSDVTFVSFSLGEDEHPVHTEDGRVCVQAGSQRCRISGYVLHYTNSNPVAGAKVILSSGLRDTISSDETGFYLFDRLLCTLNDTVCADADRYPSQGVTGYDAALVAQSAVGMISLSPMQRIAGDVSANCAVTAYDAALIAQNVAGLAPVLPAGPWIFIPEKETITDANWCSPPLCLTHTPLAMDRDGQDFVAVPVGDVSGNWNPAEGATRPLSAVSIEKNMILQQGESFALPLHLKSDEDILAIDLTLTYDQHVVVFDSVSRSEGMAHFMMVCNDQPGYVHAVWYGAKPVRKPSVFLNLWFRIVGRQGDVSMITPERVLINERSIGAPCFKVTVSENLPEVFVLEQNVPNPFNPETSIRYQIPDGPSPVKTTLRIFNILGQEVKTLVSEIQGAGQYTVRWDGRDAQGDEIPSGVYLYQLISGDFIQTKKMVYVR